MTGKKVLVTGCNGFVGQHLINSLMVDKCVVSGIDLHESSKTKIEDYASIDLTSIDLVSDFFRGKCFDEIYHLAAVSNPRIAFQDPAQCYLTNVNSAISLLEACRRSKNTKILFVGSSEEYKKKEGKKVEYSENDEIDSTTVYGS